MADIRHNWTTEEILEIHQKPLLELLYEASQVHAQHHEIGEVQISTLLSIKTGGCSEDCGYCPQSAHYKTQVEAEDLMSVDSVKAAAKQAKATGSSRLCMGAAWRDVKDNTEFEQVLQMVRAVYNEGMEACCTLGMLTESQATKLANAGLYAYNHNLDSGEEYYKEIISTRGYEDRLKTLKNVRNAKLTVCSGGIIGMGEKVKDRCSMLKTLATLNPHPESVPINGLVAVEGTPLEEQEVVPIWDMVRMIATTRIVMPDTVVRLSAGRTEMTDEGQALCFMAGAGSIFSGEKLLITPNPGENRDALLFKTLGLKPKMPYKKGDRPDLIDEPVENSPKEKWSRPGHRIPANLEASQKAKLTQ